jgi:hypothetical protein
VYCSCLEFLEQLAPCSAQALLEEFRSGSPAGLLAFLTSSSRLWFSVLIRSAAGFVCCSSICRAGRGPFFLCVDSAGLQFGFSHLINSCSGDTVLCFGRRISVGETPGHSAISRSPAHVPGARGCASFLELAQAPSALI